MSKQKLTKIIAYIVAGVLFLTSVIIICADSKKTAGMPQNELKNNTSYTEIKEKIENTSPQNTQTQEQTSVFAPPLLAPFVDMVAWVNNTTYGINGVPNLEQFYYDCGCKYYNLGFIRADDTQPLDQDGNIRWGWGGYYKLSEAGNDGYQYEGIKQSINKIRSHGGDVIVSFGGQLGRSPWTDTQNVDALEKMYLEVIEAYNLTRIDLDIEESNQNYDTNFANAKAVRRVQEQTGVEVSLTIPIMPYGWDAKQLNLIRAYLSAGVELKMINSMTMCYGYNAVGTNESFGDASIRALKSANYQLVQLMGEFGIEMSSEWAYKIMGATVDIGYENSLNPVFTADETKQVAEFAKSVGLGMYSFWCMNRDAMLEYNTAISSMYTHYKGASYYLDK